MTTSTEQLAHQFAKLNEDFTSFWGTRKADGSFDMLHPVSSKTFHAQCEELVQEALQIAPTLSETYKAIAVHNATIAGVAEGFSAAYGMSCASDLKNIKASWEGISDIAKNIEVSLITQHFRLGFYAVRDHADLSIKQSQWGDATLGCLLLNGPKYLQNYQQFDLGNNVPAIYQYFQMLKGDPDCQADWASAVEVCLFLIEHDILPISYEPARDVRRLMFGDDLVTERECSAVTKGLIGHIASDSHSLQDLAERLTVLTYNPSYLKHNFSADIKATLAKNSSSSDYDDYDDYDDDSGASFNDYSSTPLFRAKLNLLHQTLNKHHPDHDALIAAWALEKSVDDCRDLRDLHYPGDHLWIQKQLLLKLETDVVEKRVRSKMRYAEDSREWAFLEGLLEPLNQDEVRAVCGHGDLGRELGFRVSGDTRLLETVKDDEVLVSALEYSLGI